MSNPKKRTHGENLRVALIGFGIGGANFHAPIIDSTPGWKLSAVVTTSDERKRRIQAEYRNVTIYDQPDDVFRNAKNFDAVVIASPNHTHVPLAEKALNAGLTVVLDKPMAATLADCQKLIDTATASDAILTVFHNRRWDGDFLTVQQLINNETLGNVFHFESHFDRWRPQVNPQSWREKSQSEQAGGLLFDLGSHLIDQALVLFGEPVSVYCESKHQRENATVDDDTFVSLRFHNSQTAHLWTTNLAAINPPRFRLRGTAGSYEKYGMDPQEEALKSGQRPKTADHWGEEEKSRWGRFACDRDGILVVGAVRTVPGDYQQFYRQLRLAIFDGAPLPVTAEEGALVIKVIEAAKESQATGNVINLSPKILV